MTPAARAISRWGPHVGLLLLAATFRFPGVAEWPVEITPDEIDVGLEARRLLTDGLGAAFDSLGWFTLPRVTFLPGALAMAPGWGAPFQAARLASAWLGCLTMAATVALVGRWCSARAGLLAGFLFAVGAWPVFDGRVGLPFAATAAGSALSVVLLPPAGTLRPVPRCLLAGMAAGLTAMGYFPGRIVLVLAPLLLLLDPPIRRSGGRWLSVAAWLVGVLLVGWPLLLAVPWSELMGHVHEVSVANVLTRNRLRSAFGSESWVGVLAAQIGTVTGLPVSGARVAYQQPMIGGWFDPLTSLGILASLSAAARPDATGVRRLWLWALLALVPGLFLTDSPGAVYRVGVAQPALFGLAAVGGLALWDRLPVRRRSGRAALALVALLAVGGGNAANLWVSFHPRGVGDARLHGEALRWLARHCDGRDWQVVAIAARFGDSPALDLFCDRHVAWDPPDPLPPAKGPRSILVPGAPPFLLRRLEAHLPPGFAPTDPAPGRRGRFRVYDSPGPATPPASRLSGPCRSREARGDRKSGSWAHPRGACREKCRVSEIFGPGLNIPAGASSNRPVFPVGRVPAGEAGPGGASSPVSPGLVLPHHRARSLPSSRRFLGAPLEAAGGRC